jgi:hypothetical protein
MKVVESVIAGWPENFNGFHFFWGLPFPIVEIRALLLALALARVFPKPTEIYLIRMF